MTTQNVVSDEQLGILARRQNDLFRRVREGTLPVEAVLGGLQNLIEGNFDKVPQSIRRLIDCDVSPWCPDGWSIEDHRRGGQIEFDPAEIAFYLDDDQKDGRAIDGNQLRKKLEGKQVMNACVLDHLLANTNLIPDSWKVDEQGRTRYIYFWGTVYRDSGGSLCVRYLYWNGGKWPWRFSWLDDRFVDQNPAAVSAS